MAAELVPSNPRVSVVMPVYNAARYLSAALESVLEQTLSDFELVAVDDGSSDASLSILRGVANRDSRLRILSRPNTGIVGALNEGLVAVRGEFVARMDADDVALPHRFERQVAFLRANPKCVAVGSAVVQIDPEGDVICVQPWAEGHEEIDRLLLRGQGGLAHPTAMIRTATLREVGGYRVEYQWLEDKDLWLRLGEVGRLANLREPLLKYRLHESSVCSKREDEQRRLWAQLLAETYARRQITKPPPKMARSAHDRQSVHRTRARWIRAAVRGGNYATAAKHARRLFQERPFTPSTWITLARLATAMPWRRPWAHRLQKPTAGVLE